MPRIKMLRNLGQNDARVLELDPQEAKEGKEIEVSESQAEELVRCGFGELVEKEDPEQREQRQREQQQREQRQREQERQQMTSRPPSPPSPPVPPRR